MYKTSMHFPVHSWKLWSTQLAFIFIINLTSILNTHPVHVLKIVINGENNQVSYKNFQYPFSKIYFKDSYWIFIDKLLFNLSVQNWQDIAFGHLQNIKVQSDTYQYMKTKQKQKGVYSAYLNKTWNLTENVYLTLRNSYTDKSILCYFQLLFYKKDINFS